MKKKNNPKKTTDYNRERRPNDSRLMRRDETEEDIYIRNRLNPDAPNPLKIDVPDHSPFEIIPGLDATKLNELNNMILNKRIEGEVTLAGYMITKQ